MTDPVIKDAIKLRDGLLEAAKEFRILARRADRQTTRELREFDADCCEAAAKMMAKLGTEVTRLRLGIGHHLSGQMPLDRHELRKMTVDWNDADEKIEMPRLSGRPP